MGERLIGATFLIGMILLLRRWTKGKISMRFRYALWIVVVLRLLVPVSFGSASFSILNLTAGLPEDIMHVVRVFQWEQTERTGMGHTEMEDRRRPAEGQRNAVWERPFDADTGNLGRESSAHWAERFSTAEEQRILGGISLQETVGAGAAENMRLLLMCLWTAGILAVGGYMLVSQIRFVRCLRHRRKEVEREIILEAWNRRLQARQMHVYTVAGLPSPCLVGRDIYLRPQLLEDVSKLQHVLAHEYAHAVQKDTLWAVLRNALCVIYWFYPFVWIAACAAKRDSELACDERAILFLGESERFAYGRTLLDLLSGREEKSGYAGAVLIMGGSQHSIKERVSMIAGRRTQKKAVALAAALVVVLACGCTFTGAQQSQGKKILLTNPGSLSEEALEDTEEGAQSQEREERKTGENRRQNTEFEEKQGEEAVQQRADRRQREEAERDNADVEAFGEAQTAFTELLTGMDDSGLAEAEPVNLEEYWDYLYEGKEIPLKDSTWYRLPQEKEREISFYGLYTEEYGCRGMKIEIGGDVNTFDQTWTPTSFNPDVMILEESETDGLPRSFAFTVCVVNQSNSEKWQLYVADRYDTGTIDLVSFGEKAYRSQREEQNLTFRVDEEDKKVFMIREEEEILGTIDYASYDGEEQIDKILWDDGTIGYRLEEEQKRIILVTGIGLQEAESGKVLFKGIPLIDFPVEIGTFGDRSLILEAPYMDDSYVSGKLNL